MQVAAESCKLKNPALQYNNRGIMVELEDNGPDGFGLWLDGNMPSSYGTLPYLTSRRYLTTAGFRTAILLKYNLYGTKWKARAPKDEVFEAAVSALIENTANQQHRSDVLNIDAYILDPPSRQEVKGNLLLLGPRPSNARRRSTYRQIVLRADSQAANQIKEVRKLLKGVLEFSPAPISDYPFPDDFCEQAMSLLQLIGDLGLGTSVTEYFAKEGYKVSEFRWRCNC